jgi:hypothetical protein
MTVAMRLVHRRLMLSEDGVFSLLHSRDRSHLARLHPATSPFVAIVDDDEALYSSLVDLMRSVGYLRRAFCLGRDAPDVVQTRSFSAGSSQMFICPE